MPRPWELLVKTFRLNECLAVLFSHISKKTTIPLINTASTLAKKTIIPFINKASINAIKRES